MINKHKHKTKEPESMHQDAQEQPWVSYELIDLIRELNEACQRAESQGMSLRPFRFQTDGEITTVDFLGQEVWNSKGNVMAPFETVKKDILEEADCLLKTLDEVRQEMKGRGYLED